MKHDRSKLRFFKVFTSHMVLQRDRELTISGHGEAGRNVVVTFAGTERESVADAQGIWSVKFPACEAGGPFSMSVKYAGEAAAETLEDILVGEVWMCTGQSNMEMPVRSTTQPFWGQIDAEEVLKHADHPNLRLYNSMPTRRISPDVPQEEEVGTGWQACTAETLESFSACGYFFGRKLQDDLKVPVGLIAAAWGGTVIEAWISAEKYREANWDFVDEDMNPKQELWNNLLKDMEFKPLYDWLAKFDAMGQVDASWLQLENPGEGWTDCTGMKVELPRPGRYVCRMKFELPKELEGKDFQVYLGVVNDTDKSYFNGEFIGSTGLESINYWDVLREYPVSAKLARPGKNCVAVVADNHFCVGAVNPQELILICDGKKYKIDADASWKKVFEVPSDFPVRPNAPSLECRTRNMPNFPSTLFNGVLNPWFRYQVRGVIWYQGCSNSGMNRYYSLHKMLIDDMREHWHDPEMPFVLVQLAAFHSQQPERRFSDEEIDKLPIPETHGYALIREIQAEMPRVRKNVGLVAAFDCGDHSDIHPHNKQPVGERLAMKAESMLGWRKGLCDSPEFTGYRYEKDCVRVFFRNTGAGLKTIDGKEPIGFAGGERNGALFPVHAEIDGDSVVLYSSAQIELQRIRYAFTGYCKVNLVNSEGLPVLPFRTDKQDYTPDVSYR